jgi:preprotein translocase subunit SecG
MEALQNVLLIVHIVVAVLIVIMVLLQPSSGSGDGLVSSYSGTGNFMSARSAANVLSRTTMLLAAIFMSNTLALGVIAAKKSKANSIVDELIKEQNSEKKTSIPLQ